MPLACAIVLAGLCLPAPYDKAAELSAGFAIYDRKQARAEAVETLGVKINVFSSDSLVGKQAQAAADACVETACVKYVRSCSPDGLVCLFEWGSESPTTNDPESRTLFTSEFYLTANSIAAMTAAQLALSVPAAKSDGSVIHIPVASMRAAMPGPYRPPCKGQGDAPDCVNMFVGLLPTMPRPQRQ